MKPFDVLRMGADDPFLFGFYDTPGLTNEYFGSTDNGSGTTIVSTSGGTINKLYARAGSIGIPALQTVRVNLYKATSNSNWDELLATAEFTGGFAANEIRSISVSPVTIAPATRYGFSIQVLDGVTGANLASVTTQDGVGVNQNMYWPDSFADGPIDPGPAVANPNGFNRIPGMWGSN